MSTNDNEKDTIVENIYKFICRKGLIQQGDTLILGVSGGPDSVCLLHLLVALRERLDIKLHVAHLNHLLRGRESDEDARYVLQLTERLGVGATLEQRDVESYKAKHCMSLEEASRYVRYQFFADVANSLGTNQIVLGHTANDQIETILMHLIRGTGVYGLQGMQPLTQLESVADTKLTLIRPLLEVRRAEIEAYCEKYDLEPRRDASNLSASHLRNRIRNELIPLLQKYNPAIDRNLLRTADTVAVDLSFFRHYVSLIWNSIVREQEGELVMSTEEIISLHPALQRYLLREAVGQLLGNLKDIESKHIEKMIAAFNLKPGKKVVLPRGLIIYVGNGECRIARS